MSAGPFWGRASRSTRRNFLRGIGGATLALPFLESIPERSAWSAEAAPTFALFVCAVEGVVPSSFFAAATGALTSEGLAQEGKATSELSRHAEQLLFVRNVNWPQNTTGDSHAEGLAMALTAQPPLGSSSNATGAGPSADQVIASEVHPGEPPLTLFAGNLRGAYIGERLSFTGEGQVATAIDNPYLLYQELIGLVDAGGGTTPEGEEAARRLVESRNSIHDLVRDDLQTLMSDSRMSSNDRERLQQHFDAIRDAEITMDGTGDGLMESCTSAGLDIDRLEALETFNFTPQGAMIEEIAELQMSLVALAFACNYRRAATLQWGTGYDGTVYPVPANERGWVFSHISHRTQSDGSVGNDAQAEVAHAEIDVVRMQTLAAGLDHFAARGLADQSLVLWTLNYADGPSHSFRNIPHIIWGSGGGYLRQGEYVDPGATTNDRLLNTLISATIQDTGRTMEDFGEGDGGQLDQLLA